MGGLSAAQWQGVVLTRGGLARLRAAAERAHPAEACGLLLAPEGVLAADPAGLRPRLRAVRCRNVHPDPGAAYEVAPRDFLRWDRLAARRGCVVAGVWHSHPGGAPVPSASDHEQAWRGWVYLIVAGEEPDSVPRVEPEAGEGGGRSLRYARAWCWDGSGCVELPVTAA